MEGAVVHAAHCVSAPAKLKIRQTHPCDAPTAIALLTVSPLQRLHLAVLREHGCLGIPEVHAHRPWLAPVCHARREDFLACALAQDEDGRLVCGSQRIGADGLVE